ncbi:hypothetical protein AGLY_005571, partial [Aphis glycines]
YSRLLLLLLLFKKYSGELAGGDCGMANWLELRSASVRPSAFSDEPYVPPFVPIYDRESPKKINVYDRYELMTIYYLPVGETEFAPIAANGFRRTNWRALTSSVSCRGSGLQGSAATQTNSGSLYRKDRCNLNAEKTHLCCWSKADCSTDGYYCCWPPRQQRQHSVGSAAILVTIANSTPRAKYWAVGTLLPPVAARPQRFACICCMRFWSFSFWVSANLTTSGHVQPSMTTQLGN